MKIVAPAGSVDRFYAAVKAGSDEVYMGLKGFGARRNAENFTLVQYKEAIDYAHKRGVKVFLTLNTMMMDNEIEAISLNLNELYKYGLDAVIVQDFGMLKFIKENFPKLQVHASTQMTVANHVEVNFLKSIGFSRVVLPRELSFEEIKSIRKNTDIELEVFVSGALCVSYSGNCYMSSFIGGRSGNRGMCAQPCRKKYISDNGGEGYLLSPRDQLYDDNEILKLKEIGIDSIKLEGRMKEPNYVFQTVSYYKDMLNGITSDEKSSNIFNRGYGKGYFHNEKDKIINTDYASNIGTNLGTLNGNKLTLCDDIILGDGIIFLSQSFENLGGTYINKIDTAEYSNLNSAKIGDVIIIRDIPKGTKYIYKNYSKNLNDSISFKIKNTDKKHDLSFHFIGKVGKNAVLTAFTKNNYNKLITVSVESNHTIELAKEKATSKEMISKKLSEIGDSTFYAEMITTEIDNNIFIPMSVIKQLKRECVADVSKKLLDSYRLKNNEDLVRISKIPVSKKKSILSAIISTSSQMEILKSYGISKFYTKGYDVAKESNLDKIDLDNKMATNLYQVLKNKNNAVTLGWNLNIANRYAFEELSSFGKIDTIIVSPEISFQKIEDIGETKIKKAILAYGKLKGMYTELNLNNKSLCNTHGDSFVVSINELGNSEIYLKNPLNILKDRNYLESIGISELVLEFTNETEEEIKEILNGNGVYNSYNYSKGVF